MSPTLHSLFRMFRKRMVSATSIAFLAVVSAGCQDDPVVTVGDGFLSPASPGYLDILTALGIQQEMDRVARQMPWYLAFVPPVDAHGPYTVEVVRDVPFRETPQGPLRLDVYYPRTDDPTLRPAVVLYIGGGFITDLDFDTIGVWADFLASRGFVAFNTRQRLLTTPGVTRRDVLTDAIAAARFVASDGPRFGADPNRIGVMGRSSGGQLALLVGMVPSPEQFGEAGDPTVPLKIKAIVDLFSSVDDSRFFTTNEFTLLPRSAIAAVYGGLPSQVPEAYAESAPLTYVRPGLPPIFIVHGFLDTTVSISHSIVLADALEAAGDEVVREFYLDKGHVIGWGLFDNEGCGRAMSRIVPFLEQKL